MGIYSLIWSYQLKQGRVLFEWFVTMISLRQHYRTAIIVWCYKFHCVSEYAWNVWAYTELFSWIQSTSVEVPWYIGLNPWLWIKGLQVQFPSNAWHFCPSAIKTHCCSPPRCINGYLVECKRYNVFVAWCGMCAPQKWCLARMLPRELRRCTLSAGLILNPMMFFFFNCLSA